MTSCRSAGTQASKTVFSHLKQAWAHASKIAVYTSDTMMQAYRKDLFSSTCVFTCAHTCIISVYKYISFTYACVGCVNQPSDPLPFQLPYLTPLPLICYLSGFKAPFKRRKKTHHNTLNQFLYSLANIRRFLVRCKPN